MKNIFKKSLKIYFYLFVANLMSLFIIFSFDMLSVAAFTEEIGYTVYGTTKENSEVVELYSYYFQDGKDTKKQEYIDKGYTIKSSPISSNLSKKVINVTNIISAISCISIVSALVYKEMWTFGDKHKTAVKYKSERKRKFNGFFVGLITNIPSLILLIIFVVLKSVPIVFFSFSNTYLYGLIQTIAGNCLLFSDMNILKIFLVLLTLLIVPTVSHIAYILGYESVSLKEKFIYKKTKGE